MNFDSLKGGSPVKKIFQTFDLLFLCVILFLDYNYGITAMKDTKTRLLQTATELFARHGIDGVSTRDLVKASGVNLCSINYYFGTKQKLYDTILNGIIAQIGSFMTARQIPLQTKELSAIEEFDAIICNMLDIFCSNAISSSQSELLIKEIVNPTDAYNKLYTEVIEPMHKRLTDLVMRITGVSEREAIIQTHCIMGEVVMFKLHKEALLRRLGAKDYDAELVDEIKKRAVKNCNIILTGGRQ